MKEATLRDVADVAGVSPRTVSNVVNGYARVTESTRLKVEQAIAQLGYRPNVLARHLATGRSGQIVVVVPYIDTPYFAELLQAIIPVARQAGYNVLIDQSDGDREHEGQLIGPHSHRSLFDGMIYSPLGLSQQDLSNRDPALPLVVIGERTSAANFDHVGIDDVAASTEAVRHLVSLGRRRIAAIGDQPYPTGEAAQRRTAGFRAAHAEAGLEVDESLIVSTPRFNRVDGAEAMKALLELDSPPDSVFCYSDLVASGAIHTALARGLRVPEDIAVIGYDDIEDGRYNRPTISTISPDKREIARLAVERLVMRIGSKEPVPGVDLKAGYRLVARESTTGSY
ncbi:LacI family DNA-binding transcriptional regulator [Kineosporia mesophila]|uniref:LacI family DNA-binding transcriptional regulator n=1 Tax=Kineosporia mesophila TaxID=566012 RepID=UPI001E4A26D3|nr:LacI family DNA-binding transcriptional regulator [Kineosporia mesophila]MCD5354230.1 LacI family transcriptional regulator [Kineosporia mesophila]